MNCRLQTAKPVGLQAGAPVLLAAPLPGAGVEAAGGGTMPTRAPGALLVFCLLAVVAAPPRIGAATGEGLDASPAPGPAGETAAPRRPIFGILVAAEDGYEAWSDARSVAWALLHPPALEGAADLEAEVRLFCVAGRGGGAAPPTAVECPAHARGEDGSGRGAPLGLVHAAAAPPGEALAPLAARADALVAVGRAQLPAAPCAALRSPPSSY